MEKPGLGTQDPGLGESWRPSASLQTLAARAELLGSVRAFFASCGVMEVDTPVLSAHATVDRHIESFAVASPGHGLWLHTSPEFAMKRLLAAGSGPIYQIAHVFRREESGRRHNPEFTLLEWYRPGWDHHRLMDEVTAVIAQAASRLRVPVFPAPERLSYREAFARHAGFDPHTAPLSRLAQIEAPASATAAERADRDFWLDLWMGTVVGPKLGLQQPCYVHDYPASQAALARVRPGQPALADRFELFWHGLELANGFHELLDPVEQQQRFEADQAWRGERGHSVPPYDAHLIAALRAGLPDCAGVAMGVDRLLMLLLDLPDVGSAMSFSVDRA